MRSEILTQLDKNNDYYMFLRENPTWYKILNRDPTKFKDFIMYKAKGVMLLNVVIRRCSVHEQI